MSYSSCLIAVIILLVALANTFSAAKQGGGGVAMELWCVAKNNAEDTALQTAIDWACGPGGADCGPIKQGGACYDPADTLTTASYAFNDYYLKHGLTQDSCYFDNNAALTSLNPSRGKCKLPSSASVAGGNSSSAGGFADTSCTTCIISSSRWSWELLAMILLYAVRTWVDILRLPC